jgi:thiamine-phosphate diphosphorylase
MTAALAAGVRFFQYRSKNSARREIYETALRLAGQARSAGAVFIVNDHADIAAAVQADGVHVGQDDLPIREARKVVGSRIIGVSTHSTEQAVAAELSGADYIGFGPLFRTSTKDAGTPRGLEEIRVIKQSVSIPVIAIGGVHHGNAADVCFAGADGIAVISAILSAPDLKHAAADLVRVVSENAKTS